MNKLLALILITCTLNDTFANTNPRNTLITAIARNDYGTTINTLDQITDMTPDEKQEYLQMSEQMILNAIAWNNKHHILPEIGKDLLKAQGYFIAALSSGVATGIFSAFTVAILEERRFEDSRFRMNDLPPLPCMVVATAVSAGLTSYFGYNMIRKLIDAWMKPSNRLENALRIKDALLHYEVATPMPHEIYSVAFGDDQPE